ncbi:uncharacterized protein PHACADRAFT_185775 [Phanerochaete carnosa HHB-10118-sp]|uniref:Uncharacterized protein n=1 Tax=Phanerochaete carnosa (strain HHB-10118-sp) TaxID=650164 RepID=K5USQ3_PHACS|nr:uncharacterized protein PHACADRAFT_185775 [Phanerochaete carnosa HHB-10118-sp]EKM52956.1 hypothetical protein PHACADRAFT_185775 [Phanerochaete carnosa HHB-10118-sp]
MALCATSTAVIAYALCSQHHSLLRARRAIEQHVDVGDVAVRHPSEVDVDYGTQNDQPAHVTSSGQRGRADLNLNKSSRASVSRDLRRVRLHTRAQGIQRSSKQSRHHVQVRDRMPEAFHNSIGHGFPSEVLGVIRQRSIDSQRGGLSHPQKAATFLGGHAAMPLYRHLGLAKTATGAEEAPPPPPHGRRPPRHIVKRS